MTKRYEAGDQTVYMYTFHGMAPVFQTCASYGEAATWQLPTKVQLLTLVGLSGGECVHNVYYIPSLR